MLIQINCQIKHPEISEMFSSCDWTMRDLPSGESQMHQVGGDGCLPKDKVCKHIF